MEEEKAEKKISIGQFFDRIKQKASKFGRKQALEVTAVATEVTEGFTGGDPLMTVKTKHRILAALSYICILVLVPMIFGRKYDYIRFHVNQGIILLGLWVLGSFLFWLPYIGWIVVLFWFVNLVFGLVNVFSGRERRLPLIGRLAQ